MNAFQTCKNTSDVVPLYLPQQLYLKPVAKLNISLQLPNVVKVGKSISHWEIMEKLRDLIRPEEFTTLKVSKSTLEFVRFDAEVEIKKKLEPIVKKIDNKTIKLKNFSELMLIRAASAKSDFPKRNIWDSFFHDSKEMNEMKPGERPDTVYFFNLPTKWFVPYHIVDEENLLPSEKIFYKIFEKFGPIRYVDIPICDPYRNKMKDHISGIKTSNWENKEFFEGYVQFKDYIGFTKCMDVFRDMKLVHKEEDEMFSVDIKVDFDRSKHLSDASIKRREIVRDRLVKKQREKEERERNELEEKKKKDEQLKQDELHMKKQKEQRRRLREEKRKATILEKLKIKGADEINVKIAKEEKKLLRIQRKLESIRLIEELFKRIKDKREFENVNMNNSETKEADTELRRFKNTSELEVLNQKQKLHNAIQGRVMLKTVLQGEHMNNYSSSSSDEEPNITSRNPLDGMPHSGERFTTRDMYEHPMWYGYQYLPPAPAALYQPTFRGHPSYNMFSMRGRGGQPRGSYIPGTSRGYNFTRRPRGHRNQYRSVYHGRAQYTPEMEEEYIKYFSKFLQGEHDDRITRSRSRSRRSRSRSYSRHRSHSRSRSFSRSVSRNRRSRSRSRGSNYRRSYSRSRKSSSRSRKSRSRSRNSRSRSRKMRSRSRKTRSRSRKSKEARTRNKSEDRHKSSCKLSQKSKSGGTPCQDVNIEKNASRSPSIKSVDSSKFISPNQMRRERSKSWSLPKEGEKKRDSWSRSPEQSKLNYN